MSREDPSEVANNHRIKVIRQLFHQMAYRNVHIAKGNSGSRYGASHIRLESCLFDVKSTIPENGTVERILLTYLRTLLTYCKLHFADKLWTLEKNKGHFFIILELNSGIIKWPYFLPKVFSL